MNFVKKTYPTSSVFLAFILLFFSLSSLGKISVNHPELLIQQLHDTNTLFDIPNILDFNLQNLDEKPYKPFSIRELKNIIKSKKIRKLSHLIKELPIAFSGARVEVYDTKSLQCATPESPRVIMFSLDAGLFCSFNSGIRSDYKNKTNGLSCNLTTDHLECLSRNSEGLLEPSTFVFEEEEQGSETPGLSLNQQIAKVDPVSTEVIGHVKFLKNGRACTSCHSINYQNDNRLGARVIWDQYFLWPGVFGSVDDNFFGDVVDSEEALLAKYIQEKSNKSRYEHLPQKIVDRPAFAMNNLQTVSNADRIIRSIYFSSNHSKFKPILTGAANRCDFRSTPESTNGIGELAGLKISKEILKLTQEHKDGYRKDSYAHGRIQLERQKKILGEDGIQSGRLSYDSGLITASFPRISQNTASKSNFHQYRAVADLMGIPTYLWTGNMDATNYYFNSGHSSEVPIIIDEVIKALEPAQSCMEIF